MPPYLTWVYAAHDGHMLATLSTVEVSEGYHGSRPVTATRRRNIELTGREMFDGKDAYRLRVVFPDGWVNELFVDKRTWKRRRWQNFEKRCALKRSG